MESDKILQTASLVEKQYKDGLNYFRQMGFTDDWPEYSRFRQGLQWPAPTERTRNLPRPVFNIIKLIQAHKVSTVMNENVKMVFSPEEGETDPNHSQAAEMYTGFADRTWERIKQSKLNERALKNGSNKGLAVWHYYWDNDDEGGLNFAYKGNMQGEVIDPINIFFGNPQDEEVQSQPYIIISQRRLVKDVQDEAKANGIKPEFVALIKADANTEEEGYDGAKHELNDSEKVTVLTKYYKDKKSGTVYFVKAASGVVVKETTDTMLRKYPIAIMQWDERDKCIYGIGDTEGLIPNQKAVNFLMAMQLLSVQLTGWPKLVYKDGAVDAHLITNTPGEMIRDKIPNPGFNVQYLNPGPVSNVAEMLVEKFIDFTKEVTGANDSALGEQKTSQLNASALVLLQKAAGVPIEGIRRRFYQAQEDIGLIWMEFFRVYYNTTRLMLLEDEMGNEQATLFNGAAYADVPLNLKIDIGPASFYSESLMMTSLDRFLDNGMITFKQYLEYAPKNVVPFKDRLLKEIEEQEEMQAQQQQDIISQLPPDQQAEFMQMPPEQQQAFLQQAMSQPQQQMGGM